MQKQKEFCIKQDSSGLKGNNFCFLIKNLMKQKHIQKYSSPFKNTEKQKYERGFFSI